MSRSFQTLGLDVSVRDKDDNDITLKDYGDEEVDNDRKYSIDNLGAEVLDTDDFMYDDEEGVVADDDPGIGQG